MPSSKKDKEKKTVKRCITMFTDEVSVVTRGANGHAEFLMVKADGDIGQIVDDIEKAVPSKDADNDAKVKAQNARAKKYGIEVLPKGSNLSYPKGDPTTERLFGDPVNLKYPLAYENDTKPDAGRTRNALARFKQNSDTYSKPASKTRVYERIVRAAMAAKIKVSFNPDDPIDNSLPKDLQTRLQKNDDTQTQQTEPNSTELGDDAGAPDLGWVDTIEKSIDDDSVDWLGHADEIASSVEGSHGESVENKGGAGSAGEPPAKPMKKADPPKETGPLEILKKELAGKTKEIAKLMKENVRLTAEIGRLNASIGPRSSLKPGESGTNDDDEMDNLNSSIDLSPALHN